MPRDTTDVVPNVPESGAGTRRDWLRRLLPRQALQRIKISFRSGMIGLSLLFVVGGALSAHLPWIWVSRADVKLLVTQLNTTLVHDTNQEVDDLFNSAREEQDGLLTMLQSGVVDPADPAKLQQAMFALLRAHKQFSFVTFGLPNGGFYFAQRIDEHELSVGHTTWDERRGVASWTEDRYAVNADGAFYTRTLRHEDDANATQRPWYVGAVAAPGKTSWTKMFTLVSGRPGVAASTAFLRNGTLVGVVSIAVELVRLSDYLAGLDLGHDSAAFILGRDGSLVAFSDPHESLAAGPDSSLRKIADAFHPKLTLANAAIAANHIDLATIDAPRQITARDADDLYFITLAPDGRPDWLIGTIVPERDFLGAVEDNREDLILGAIAALALCGLAAAGLSRLLFIRPLMMMIEETRSIERFDLDAVRPVRSVIRELDRLSDALMRMASGLGSFRRFLPADLVHELMTQGFTAEVGGERRTVTVLFMDVANFTTLTERMGHRILPLLGDYLSDMTRALMDHRATIDKFIGDAVMAFWGAPRFNEEHSADACRAALECTRRMEERRSKWAAEGKPQLHIRIGINTGRVVVGNIGSRDRLDYTVIGDAVNLASRLEGLNKTYGTGIIIGPATYELAKYDIVARRLDHVNVKGKEETVAVYELLAMADPDADRVTAPWISAYERGLDLFYAGDIAKAREQFVEALKLRGEDQPAARFVRLCDERLGGQAPPQLVHASARA
jgi:adenylate cyclase